MSPVSKQGMVAGVITTVPRLIDLADLGGVYPATQRVLSLGWRNKSRFTPYYYSYSKSLQEARGRGRRERQALICKKDSVAAATANFGLPYIYGCPSPGGAVIVPNVSP